MPVFSSAWKASQPYLPRALVPRTTAEIKKKQAEKPFKRGWVGRVNFLAMIFYKISTKIFDNLIQRVAK